MGFYPTLHRAMSHMEDWPGSSGGTRAVRSGSLYLSMHLARSWRLCGSSSFASAAHHEMLTDSAQERLFDMSILRL